MLGEFLDEESPLNGLDKSLGESLNRVELPKQVLGRPIVRSDAFERKCIEGCKFYSPVDVTQHNHLDMV